VHSNIVNAIDPCTVVTPPPTQTPALAAAGTQAAAAQPQRQARGKVVPANSSNLSSQREGSEELPVVINFLRRVRALQDKKREISPLNLKTFSGGVGPDEEITLGFNLTTLEQVFPAGVTPPPRSAPLQMTQPRLRENAPLTGPEGMPVHTIDIPLFSDLRRHQMGVGLADAFEQETDVSGILVPKPLFLTRPLWGVADAAPFLHDGRALSLDAAILAHGSNGSEAQKLIQDLNPVQRASIVQFLLTLRLAHDPRYGFDKNLTFIETNEPLPGTTGPLQLQP
jgi:hypothetical protein